MNGKYFGTGFTQVPGGNDYRNRSVLSYHYYCVFLSIAPMPSNGTEPIFDRILCDDVEGPALFHSVQKDLGQLGGASFMTEFGGCENSPVCDEQLDWGLMGADQFLQSWAFWGNSYNDRSTIKRLSRVYARAIAGIPLSMQFLANQSLFYLSYYIDINIKQPTEIVIPDIQYPQSSYNITVNSVLKWKVNSTNPTIIFIEPSDQFLESRQQQVIGIIDIRPKDQNHLFFFSSNFLSE